MIDIIDSGINDDERVIIIIPKNDSDNETYGIRARCLHDVDTYIKYLSISDEINKMLLKHTAILFDNGVIELSIVQSKNCTDIIIL